MRALVLGSEGQIGSHLTKYLKDQGNEVIEIDYALGPEHDLRERFNSKVWAGMNNCDFVYFLAFDVGGSTYLKSYQNSTEFLDNNVDIMKYTFRLLERSQKPFLFASSQMSNMNHSPYGVLKRLGEFYTHALGGIVVKFWNVYGVEKDPTKFHVITDFIRMAAQDGIIEMKTTGEEERQFLYADDCSEALVRLAQQFDFIDKSQSYDITSYEWVSVREIAEMISHMYGMVPIIFGKEIDRVQGVRNEPNNNILDFWEPTTSLKKGIKKVNELMKDQWKVNG